MKLAIAALALVASSASAQDCRTKQGQVVYIKNLIDQWTLYKKQVAANNVLSNDQAGEENTRAARQIELEAHNAEKLANLTVATAARKVQIAADATAARAAVDTDLASIIGGIDTEELRKTEEIVGKATAFATGVANRVSKLNDKKDRINAALTKAQNKALAKRDRQLIRAQSKHTAASGETTTAKNSKQARHQELLAEKLHNNTVTQGNKLQDNQDRFVRRRDALLATKKDAAGTLASLDNAGTTGLSFPGDCLLDAAAVIAEVKTGNNAADIWKHLITPGYY